MARSCLSREKRKPPEMRTRADATLQAPLLLRGRRDSVGRSAGATAPYLAQIDRELSGHRQIVRIGNRGNEYLGTRTFAWYLGEKWKHPATGSSVKGLACDQDHVHHAYWRLDFDLGEAAHHRAGYREAERCAITRTKQTTSRNPARTFYVRNPTHGHIAWISPGPSDVSPTRSRGSVALQDRESWLLGRRAYGRTQIWCSGISHTCTFIGRSLATPGIGQGRRYNSSSRRS